MQKTSKKVQILVVCLMSASLGLTIAYFGVYMVIASIFLMGVIAVMYDYYLSQAIVKFPRKCDECGRGMFEGYCIDQGTEYYCSDKCLHKHYTHKEWLDMYEDGGDSYWTTWELDDDDYWYEGTSNGIVTECESEEFKNGGEILCDDDVDRSGIEECKRRVEDLIEEIKGGFKR
jgi:hypothetical protein